MITPNAHTLLLGKAVYASMLVLHVLCGQGSKVDVGHIRALMAQQPGHREVSVQSAHALVHQFLILLRCKGVAKSVKGQGRVRLYLNAASMRRDEQLQAVDGLVGRHFVRHQQFVAPLGACQLTPQGNGDLLVDGNGADLAALALDGNSVLPKGLLCGGGGVYCSS